MARAPKRAAQRPGSRANGEATDPREAIVDAFMALAAERRVRDVGLSEIAERAGISLGALRELFSGKAAILAAFSRRVDLAVLADGAADPDAPARDRLFEVMMRRFDALKPYKAAVRRMARSASCDPALAALLHRLAVRSQRWTLEAAGIRFRGLRGCVAVEGVVCVYGETLRTWLDDDDADLGRTMATLDRALTRGERGMTMLGELCSLLPRFSGFGHRRADGGVASAV